MGKQWKLTNVVFLGSKITADGDCIHEIRRHLLLERKAMTNLDSLLKSRDTTLLTKLCILKEIVFPVQFSHWVMSDFLWPHELQHTRPPCPPPTPRVYTNSCPLSRWCHPTISSSVVPFSSYLQSFPTSGFFSNESALWIRWPKYWSFSFNISPSSEHPGLISFRMVQMDLLAVQGTLKSLQHHSSKASIFSAQLSSESNSYIHTWPLEKP